MAIKSETTKATHAGKWEFAPLVKCPSWLRQKSKRKTAPQAAPTKPEDDIDKAAPTKPEDDIDKDMDAIDQAVPTKPEGYIDKSSDSGSSAATFANDFRDKDASRGSADSHVSSQLEEQSIKDYEWACTQVFIARMSRATEDVESACFLQDTKLSL
eukprot:TRINITY_DN6743_c0_g1_i1.p2 TRINITY_DN6743_c0_g1~~TRINITY_DN6743_c0_g1_i1.p2  ORF type:complete len:156 (-),score=37.65 TRINITY_DN6743_c0_g1_i1:159-626(-)